MFSLKINLIILFITLSLLQIKAHGQVNIESKRTNSKEKTKILSELGLNYREGSVKELELKYSLRLDYNFNKNNKLINIFEYVYGEANEEKFKDELFFHSRITSMLFLKNTLGIEFFIQTQKNEFYNINLRQLGGTGLRYQLFHIILFDGYIGLGAMKEYEIIQEEKNNNDIRSTNYLTLVIDKEKKYKLLSTTYYQPLFVEYKDYRINSELAIIFYLSKYISFKNSVNYLYDSNPPKDIEANNASVNLNLILEY